MNVLFRFNLLEQEKIQVFDDLIASTFRAGTKRYKKIPMGINIYLIDFLCKHHDGNPINELKLSSNVYHGALDRLYQILPHVLKDSAEGVSNRI